MVDVGRRSSLCAGALLLAGLGIAPGFDLLAQPGEPTLPARVFVDAEPRCADPEARTVLSEALQARLPTTPVEMGAGGAPDEPVIRWTEVGPGRCQIYVTTASGVESLPLGPGASPDDIRAAAVRLAWWIETSAEGPVGPTGPTGPTGPASAAEPTLSIGAQFGAAWFPTPALATGLVRVLVGVRIAPRLQLALEGRFLTELEPTEAADLDVLERSVGLFGRYQERLGERWQIDSVIGLRYAFQLVELEDTDRADVASTAANLSVAAGLGAGWYVTDLLRLEADVLGAVSLDARDVVADGQVIGELGVFTLDALLGFELSF